MCAAFWCLNLVETEMLSFRIQVYDPSADTLRVPCVCVCVSHAARRAGGGTGQELHPMCTLRRVRSSSTGETYNQMITI